MDSTFMALRGELIAPILAEAPARSMCNSYNVQKRLLKKGDTSREVEAVAELVDGLVENLPSALVRRAGRGGVVTGMEGELVASTMRWGFLHPTYREVNNTRASSLKSPFWADSLAQRRCIVPVASYYEWSDIPGIRNGKQAYEFRFSDSRWMWVAGLYQSFEPHGFCYSMITTEPSVTVAPIHDRMPAILDWDSAMAFLAGDFIPQDPYQGDILVTACASPLKKLNGQGELF